MIKGDPENTEINLAKDTNYFKNLENCILDAQKAALNSDCGPTDPIKFSDLCSRLKKCQSKIPPIYYESVLKPYLDHLGQLGESGFDQILRRDSRREGEACLMLDIAQAILQRGEDYQKKALDAFQEVVCDLYDGFLSAEDRRGIKTPDLEAIAPLAKWGDTESGPYTWPADSTINFGVRTAIVNLPAANAQNGIFAWASISHETAGHDIIHVDKGLNQELMDCLRNSMNKANITSKLTNYWASRIDETASDVLGILNMGPAAGMALIGYFRALNAVSIGSPVLRSVGPREDPHPADILRGYLAASVVKRLDFGKADRWATAIEAETDKDVNEIKLGSSNSIITPDEAKESTDLIATCLVQTKMKSLNSHALGDIQNWYDSDEQKVKHIRSALKITDPLPEPYDNEIYAAHVVAATVVEALQGKTGNPVLLERMRNILKTLHDRNPSWGPNYVKHSGNMIPLKTYVRHKQSQN